MNAGDVEFDARLRDGIMQRVSTSRPFELAGRPVLGIDNRDGVKILLEDGYWALIRFSGTEPLLRIYAEGAIHSRRGRDARRGPRPDRNLAFFQPSSRLPTVIPA